MFPSVSDEIMLSVLFYSLFTQRVIIFPFFFLCLIGGCNFVVPYNRPLFCSVSPFGKRPRKRDDASQGVCPILNTFWRNPGSLTTDPEGIQQVRLVQQNREGRKHRIAYQIWNRQIFVFYLECCFSEPLIWAVWIKSRGSCALQYLHSAWSAGSSTACQPTVVCAEPAGGHNSDCAAECRGGDWKGKHTGQ